MRKALRRYIPAEWRLRARLLLNLWRERKTRGGLEWAKPVSHVISGYRVAELEQPIRRTSRSEEKIHNIGMAMKKLHRALILPGQVFSFWQCVGHPSTREGYQKGRNLVNGVLTEDTGGGLCQLAGIIYHTALLTGLDVVERYNHSVDIYREHERYTPLGADATVVFGYKDLKLSNPYAFPVQLLLHLKPVALGCSIATQEPVEPDEIKFLRKDLGHQWEVRTLRIQPESEDCTLSVDYYNKR
jgi:vancomycin resistance protein VanW